MNRGDIYNVDFNPTRGREQQGARYALLVSPFEFNRGGLVLACPITIGGNYAREKGFAVSLIGTGGSVQGVVLCSQLRSLDIKSRKGRFVETAPDYIVNDVIAKLMALLD